MANNDGFNKQQIQQLRSLFDESESRLTRKNQDYTDQWVGILRREMSQLAIEISSSVADIVDNALVPRLDDHEKRLTKLEIIKA